MKSLPLVRIDYPGRVTGKIEVNRIFGGTELLKEPRRDKPV